MSFLKKLAKLVDVKSIVTLTLTAVFSYLSIKGVIGAEQFLSIFTVIISFYFGTQYGKHEIEKVVTENGEDKDKAG